MFLSPKKSYPKCPDGMSLNEWKARVDLAAIYRLIDYYGWTSVVYNLSLIHI